MHKKKAGRWFGAAEPREARLSRPATRPLCGSRKAEERKTRNRVTRSSPLQAMRMIEFIDQTGKLVKSIKVLGLPGMSTTNANNHRLKCCLGGESGRWHRRKKPTRRCRQKVNRGRRGARELEDVRFSRNRRAAAVSLWQTLLSNPGQPFLLGDFGPPQRLCGQRVPNFGTFSRWGASPCEVSRPWIDDSATRTTCPTATPAAGKAAKAGSGGDGIIRLMQCMIDSAQ